MIKEEIRFSNSNIMEGMTSISALLDAKARGINDREIFEIKFDREKAKKKARELSFPFVRLLWKFQHTLHSPAPPCLP